MTAPSTPEGEDQQRRACPICDPPPKPTEEDLRALRELTLNWPGVDPRTGRFKCFVEPITATEEQP